MKKYLLAYLLFALKLIIYCQLNGSGYIIEHIGSQKYISAIIQLKDTVYKKDLIAESVIIRTDLGTILTCLIPENKLKCIKTADYIIAFEGAMYSNAVRFKNEGARLHSKVNQVQNGLNNGLVKNYGGKNVLVGIVDIGFQTDNPSFYAKDSVSYRVKQFWDQSALQNNGPTPYLYGKLCQTPNEILNQVDLDGSHGTHVAAIAAGSGLSTPGLKHRGMAPESDLIFVKIKYATDAIPGSAYGDYIVANPNIIDAYSFIFKYAKANNQAAVINLSWGMHTGPHDGSSLFDKAVEELVKNAGHIIVGANGNDGNNDMHFSYQFNKDTIKTIPIDRLRNFSNKESVYTDVWGSKNMPFSFRLHLYDTSKNILVSSPFYNSNTLSRLDTINSANGDTLIFELQIQANYIHNQKPNVLIMATNYKPKKNFIVLEFFSDSGRIDAWNSGDALNWSTGFFVDKIRNASFLTGFKKGDNMHTMGENGGTGKGTISVGAYINRAIWVSNKGKLIDESNSLTPGNYASFSSIGPTIDGRIKPDIAAPGQNIVSAVNNRDFRDFNSNALADISVFNNDTQFWVSYSGTSMAAPHVTGIVALMLEANPNLNAAQVSFILKNTAMQDAFTGQLPNNRWGYGKVNALAAVSAAEKQSFLDQLSEANVKVFPNPSDGVFTVEVIANNITLKIYDLNGKQLSAATLQSGSNKININQNGLMLLYFENNGLYFVKKVLIN